MSRRLGVVVAVLLASGTLASCGMLQSRSTPPPPAPTTPAIPTRPTVQPTVVHPPKPVVTSAAPSDNQVLTKNKLYSAAVMRSVGCREPKVSPTSASAVRTYYATLKTCLDRAWVPTVRAAGYGFRAPALKVWSSGVDTPCGPGSGIVSFYCGSDETVYPSGDEILFVNRTYGERPARRWATHVLPHEYGHHVQQLTGILTAYNHLYNEASDEATKDQLTRRLELQASCLGHVFLIANKASYPITSAMLRDWSWRTIKIPNHGSEANQRYWINRAVQLKRPGACNTWAAPAAQVS